ncbi:MAG TPA: Tad domain-containing protein, partial [Anaerolineales bacterium]|nr:Tad domain-containing protein [Anaerolineales bacterium]
MKPKLQERGQALVIIALAAVGLFGFSALAIDGSRVFSDRRNAQNAADTAALSAALAQVRGNDYEAAALARAASNGYVTDANSVVEVHLCSESGLTPPCDGLPGGANPSEYIQVKIVSTIPATFARILGRTHFTNVLTAVARSQGAIPSPLANGNALAALAPDEPDAIYGNGNVFLQVNNSGIFSNSSVTDNSPPCQEGAMSTVGNGSFTVDTSIQVVGTFCQGNNTTVNGPVQSASQMPYPPVITIPIPNITCSGNGSATPSQIDGEPTVTYSPGNYGNINLTSTGNVHFNPGNYCFNGGVSFTGPDVIANDVNFLITSGEFRIAGNGTFRCNDMLVHIDGGSGMRFNGGGGNFCNNVTFIASTGNVSWNGNITN